MQEGTRFPLIWWSMTMSCSRSMQLSTPPHLRRASMSTGSSLKAASGMSSSNNFRNLYPRCLSSCLHSIESSLSEGLARLLAIDVPYLLLPCCAKSLICLVTCLGTCMLVLICQLFPGRPWPHPRACTEHLTNNMFKVAAGFSRMILLKRLEQPYR